MLTSTETLMATALPAAAPVNEAPLVTYRSYGVEFRQGLTPLPTRIFFVLRERVAGVIADIAQRKGIPLTSPECESCAEFTVALFHARGECGPLYSHDTATLDRLEAIVDWALEQGAGATAALDAATVTARDERRRECDELLRERPPLPEHVYEAVRARALPMLRLIAKCKNVPPAVADSDARAWRSVEFLHGYGLAEQLLDDDPEAIELLEYGADNDLDGLAILHAVQASARAQGIGDDQLDWDMLSLLTGEAMMRLRDRYRAGSLYRWPDLEGGVAAAFAELGIPAFDLRGAVKT